MQNVFGTTRVKLRAAAALMLALMCLCSTALPLQAFGMETVKCTARPNADSGNGVIGATVTRITWEGQCAEDESPASIDITLPDNTEFDISDARVTLLSGADMMTREPVAFSASTQAQTARFVFDDALKPGAYIRVEIYNVKFPASGGDLQITGTYTLEDGTVHAIDGIPTIAVTGVSPTDALAKSLSEQEWVQQWNSNNFLRLFFNPPILVTSFPVVFNGFLMALAIVAVAFPLAIPFGLLLSLMRMSKLRVLRGLATTYVNVVRGTPLFLQIYIAFFGLPLAGLQVPSFPLGVIVLSMNSCAYLCEIFRAGIQSIPKGQFEAARSLGMNGAQTMLFVIIPQTVRRVIPTMTSEFILLYKDTSLLAAVGVMEVVMYAKTIVASTGSITPYIVAACFYLVITLPLAKIVGSLEDRLAGNKPSKRKKHKSKQRAAGAVSEGAGGEAVSVSQAAFAAGDEVVVAKGGADV